MPRCQKYHKAHPSSFLSYLNKKKTSLNIVISLQKLSVIFKKAEYVEQIVCSISWWLAAKAIEPPAGKSSKHLLTI